MMADPLTALGTIAAASQLASQCLNLTLFICSLPSQFRESRELVVETAQQIEHFTSIARQIISNPSLQTGTMAGVLERCLEETRKLSSFLEDLAVEQRNSRVKRWIKGFKAIKSKGVVKDRVERVNKWRALLALCVAETDSANMHATSGKMQESIDRSCVLVEGTLLEVRKIGDLLPGIFTQLSVIEGKLQALDQRMKNGSEEVLSVPLRRDMNPVIQHLMLNQPSFLAHSHFGHNTLTHYLMPVPRNKTFSRFNDTIKDLKRQYKYGTKSSERTIALTGVVCGGKTQVALDFCYQAQAEQLFGAIFWVKASSRSAIENSFRKIADRLNVDVHESLAVRISITMSVLKAWPCRWLMVFSDCIGSDGKAELRNYMPESEQGAYLITKPFEKGKEWKRVRLPDLGFLDIVELLMMKSGADRSDENYEEAVKLVGRLNKIPLVVMEVGRYIRRSKVSFSRFTSMLDKKNRMEITHSHGLRKVWYERLGLGV